MIKSAAVAGAGTMGSGIALSLSLAGLPVVLFDTNEAGLKRAEEAILANLSYLLSKDKLSKEERDAVFARISLTSNIRECRGDIVIEAIVEDIAAKIDLFNQLDTVNEAGCIFASNTSSLSVSAIQHGVADPQRLAGMHFFNPAHIMKLVEVVKAECTSGKTVDAITSLCRQLKKTPVLCIDAPGFIVNRVARPYYLEAMKLVETGICTFEDVDTIMESSGFKMGPFRLMDLIGIDINYAVASSLYQALDKPERLMPSPMQAEKIEKGELGKKTGKGFYDHKK